MNTRNMNRARAAFGGLLLTLPFVIAAQTSSQTQTNPRPMRVDDLFEIEELGRDSGGPVKISPDGRAIAVTWGRAQKTSVNFNHTSPWNASENDIWVQASAGAKAVNITHGAKDGSGWFGAVWSPNGSKLALLSTRGGNTPLWKNGNGVVWIWDKNSNRLRQLTTRKAVRYLRQGRTVSWLDERQILVALQPQEAPSPWAELPQMQRIAVEAWKKNSQGKQTTGSVLDSGLPWDDSKSAQSQLVLVDVASGKLRTIVDGNANGWELSPGKQAISYFRQTTAYAPTALDKIQMNERDGRFALHIVDLQGKPLFANEPSFADVVGRSLQWSADGGEFVFVGAVKLGDPARIFRGSLARNTVEELKLGDLDASPPDQETAQVRWTPKGELLVLASQKAPADSKADVKAKARRDWWLVRADGTRQCLTQALESAPKELWAQEGNEAFVGVSKDELWRIDASGQTTNLTANFAPKVEMLAYPHNNPNSVIEVSRQDRRYSKVVLAVREPQQPFDYHVLDLASGVISPLKKPDVDAEVINFAPQTDSAVFYASGRRGTWLWRSAATRGESQTLIQANTFLQGIAESEYRMIEYRSLNGKKLRGWILLPYGYQKGVRYPLLTWVYNGSEVPEKANKPSGSHRLGATGSLNMQVATASGFAVLIPSMPLGPDGGPDDPLLKLTDGVLPAVDKAIELGIADEDRLFVSGHSFGGFSTYGLVTQTDRFKAAIAHNGITNLVNVYGVFTAPARYDDNVNDSLGYNIGWSEAGQGRMGNPPWKDLGRYLRNSPITYVDRVNTPLLMIHSDIDICPIADIENFFRSLYRQGKRAQFVRYWGEGHTLQSPANIRDMWQRMLGWMDQYGDIQRDAQGNMVFENGKVKGREPAAK